MDTPLFILFVLMAVAVTVCWVMVLKKSRKIALLQEENQLIEQERELVIHFMHSLVDAIGGGAGRKELWQRIVNVSMQATHATSAAIFEVEEEDEGMLRGVAVQGLFPPQHPLSEFARMKLTTRTKFIESVLKSETIKIGEGFIGGVAHSGKGELVEDATRDPRINQHEDSLLQVKSIIACPIIFQEKLLGVLTVANPAGNLPFSQIDFSLIVNLAEQAGLAIHNADALHLQMEKKRMDMELELASNIQSMLLPQEFPESDELDIGATYIPAQKVGGDLFDIFTLPNNRIGVAIADVSGKGVPGSLLMAICQTNLRHYGRQFESPSAVLAAINHEMMSAGMRKDKFVTMVYVIFDLDRKEMTLARAGHEKPILLRQYQSPSEKRALEKIDSEGMALGMVPGTLFRSLIEDKVMKFDTGDTLLLYTDGVTEASNEEGTEYSFSRLADSLITLRERNAEELIEGILEKVARFSGKETYEDDLTLIALKHK